MSKPTKEGPTSKTVKSKPGKTDTTAKEAPRSKTVKEPSRNVNTTTKEVPRSKTVKEPSGKTDKSTNGAKPPQTITPVSETMDTSTKGAPSPKIDTSQSAKIDTPTMGAESSKTAKSQSVKKETTKKKEAAKNTVMSPSGEMDTTTKGAQTAGSPTSTSAKKPAENPMNAMMFELKEAEIQKAGPSEVMGLFVKARRKLRQLYISRITAGSTSDKAGAKPGDYVLAINGHRVETKAQLAEEVNRNQDTVIHLMLARHRSNPLDPRDLKPPGNAPRRPKCNYHLCRLDPMQRPTLGMDLMECRDKDVVAASVAMDGLAFWAGLQAQDRLLMVGTEVVRDQKQCEELLKNNEGKVFDILIERPEEAEQHCQALDQTAFELQKVHTVSNTPTAGVPEAPPEVSKMMTSRMGSIMKNLRAAGFKRKPKQPKGKAKPKPPKP